FLLVSAGNIYNITATENRFKKTQSAFENIQRHAEVYNPYETPGTGLVALGGMSFDPLKEKSSLWENFADSQLHIPEILITKYNGEFYLTKNAYLSTEDDPHTIAEELLEKEQKLLTETNQKQDRKSTRLNSSHVSISYAVFCLKKKTKIQRLYQKVT